MNYDYNTTLTYENLYVSALKCSKNVKWKRTTAYFLLNQLEETYKLKEQLLNGTYKERKHKVFKVYEPKEREVLSIAFRDRVYQRLLNDLLIYPIMTKSFIYDNCACQKGKGTDFARNRIKHHLRRYYAENKSNQGYFVHIDIKKFYPTIDHKVAESLFERKLPHDTYIKVLDILKGYDNYKGYYAGSQLIQILGVSILDTIDHYIKEILKVKHYVRYMDDLLLIVKDRPNYYIRKVESKIKELKFELNDEKTTITKLCKGENFLGFIFLLNEKGKVYQCLSTKNIKRARRKNKTRDRQSFETWYSYAIKSTSQKRIREVKRDYESRN